MSALTHMTPAQAPTREFGTIERWWNDPAYRAQLAAERKEGQRRMDALFASHDAAARQKQEARWSSEELPSDAWDAAKMEAR